MSKIVYERVKSAAKETGMERLKLLYIALDEKIAYDEIRVVVAHLKGR